MSITRSKFLIFNLGILSIFMLVNCKNKNVSLPLSTKTNNTSISLKSADRTSEQMAVILNILDDESEDN